MNTHLPAIVVIYYILQFSQDSSCPKEGHNFWILTDVNLQGDNQPPRSIWLIHRLRIRVFNWSMDSQYVYSSISYYTFIYLSYIYYIFIIYLLYIYIYIYHIFIIYYIFIIDFPLFTIQSKFLVFIQLPMDQEAAALCIRQADPSRHGKTAEVIVNVKSMKTETY